MRDSQVFLSFCQSTFHPWSLLCSYGCCHQKRAGVAGAEVAALSNYEAASAIIHEIVSFLALSGFWWCFCSTTRLPEGFPRVFVRHSRQYLTILLFWVWFWTPVELPLGHLSTKTTAKIVPLCHCAGINAMLASLAIKSSITVYMPCMLAYSSCLPAVGIERVFMHALLFTPLCAWQLAMCWSSFCFCCQS